MGVKKPFNVLGIPVWLLALGIILGVAIGSFDRLRSHLPAVRDESAASDAATGSRDPVQNNSGRFAADPKSGQPSPVSNRPATVSTPEAAGTQIIAANGLIVEPARQGSQFIGYRIITNTVDSRMQVGDIVTAVNGAPLEDSAAGGELFVVALRNHDAALTIQHEAPRDDRPTGKN